MRAAHAILVLLSLTAVACKDDDGCDGAACQTAKAAIGDRPIHDTAQKTFTSEDGLSYTLVRIEYGATQECDELDEEDCWYSTYCAFVFEGQDYPLDAYFVSEEDELDIGDEWSAYELAIFEDEAFDEWLWEAEENEDVLAECF